MTATALFGLRYFPYVTLAAVASTLGIDAKPPVPIWHISQALVIGLDLVATPFSWSSAPSPWVSLLLIGLAGAWAVPGLRPAGGGRPHRLFQLDPRRLGRLLLGIGGRGHLGGSAGKARAPDEHGHLSELSGDTECLKSDGY